MESSRAARAGLVAWVVLRVSGGTFHFHVFIEYCFFCLMFFPLLVLKGNNHYWKICVFFFPTCVSFACHGHGLAPIKAYPGHKVDTMLSFHPISWVSVSSRLKSEQQPQELVPKSQDTHVWFCDLFLFFELVTFVGWFVNGNDQETRNPFWGSSL